MLKCSDRDRDLDHLVFISKDLNLECAIIVGCQVIMQGIAQLKGLSNLLSTCSLNLLDLLLGDEEGEEHLMMALWQEANLSPLEGEVVEEGEISWLCCACLEYCFFYFMQIASDIKLSCKRIDYLLCFYLGGVFNFLYFIML